MNVRRNFYPLPVVRSDDGLSFGDVGGGGHADKELNRLNAVGFVGPIRSSSGREAR